MKVNGIGKYNTINAFVDAKLEAFKSMEINFNSFFELMFREKENVMYEKSEGYRIIKTTYGDSYNSILKKATTLKGLLNDIPKGSVIGISMDNSLEWIEAFWSVIVCGYKPLLINLRLSDLSVENALNDCEVKAVISDAKTYSVKTIMSENVICAETMIQSETFGSEILVMSSGTSTHIKICAYSAEEFYYQILDSYQIIKDCKKIKEHYDGNLKLLTFLPFYHVFGLIAVYIWFAFFSRTFVHLGNMLPQTIVNTVKRHKVTHIFAVPLFWEKVHSEAVKTIKSRGEKTFKKFNKGLKLSIKLGDVPIIGNLFIKSAFKEVRENLFGESIRFMITGGSSIDTNTMEFFNGIGYHLADGYGMTEIGITSVELSSKKKILNDCYIGKPMSCVEYKINDDGELLVRGKVIAKYIIENGEKKQRGDWFNTHDLAVCDNGHYKILGRKDDVIIASNGENLNPNLIEPYFNLPNVNSVCLIGAKSNAEVIPILLVSVNRYLTKDNFDKLENAVKSKINSLNLTNQIRKIVYISDSIMLEDEFKLNRLRLTKDYEEGNFNLVEPTILAVEDNNDILLEQIKQIFAIALNKDKDEIVREYDFFLDGGGTSLDYFAMVSKMQDEFNIPFPTSEGKGINTVEDFYNYIKAAMKNVD